MNRVITEDGILSNLNKYFEYSTLRPGQLHIVQNILDGKDALITKEIGFGKSLCYQLSCLIREGVMVIISFSLSRVENKYQQLLKFENIKSALLYDDAKNNDGHDNALDLRNVLIKRNKLLEDLRNFTDSGLKFLFVTLDYFMNSNRLRQILKELSEKKLLQAIVIDEVQCLELWSDSSMKDYTNLGSTRDVYPNTPFLCFTRPMSKKSLQLIRQTLCLKTPYISNEPSVRDNLSFKVMYKGDEFPVSKLIDFVKNTYSNKSGFIYSQNKDECQKLLKAFQEKAVTCIYYHSALTDNEKLWLEWINQFGVVVICVSGSDADCLEIIDFVIHATVPSSLDIYIQEVGKAGKNRASGDCIIFYSIVDCNVNFRSTIDAYKETISRSSHESKLQLEMELKDAMSEIFDVVVYAENIGVCRQIFLLTYFNEDNVVESCGVCDVCEIMKDSFVIDMSHCMKQILMTIWAINKHQKVNSHEFFNATIENVIGLLRGNVKKSLLDSGMVKEWFFGCFGSWDQQLLHRLIFILLSNKFIMVNQHFGSNYEVFQNLIITIKGQAFVKGNNEFNVAFSRKDISLSKWTNVYWIETQFKKDLENSVLYHSLHDSNHCAFELYRVYIEHLFHATPGTWDEFKNIKFRYITGPKCEFDEDLFTICLMYHQILRKLNDGDNGTFEQSQNERSAKFRTGLTGWFY